MMDDDDMYGDFYDEDDDDDDEDVYGRRHRHNYDDDGDDDDDEGDASQRETQLAWVKEQPFSVPRVRFMTRTDALRQRLDELTKEEKDDENEEEGEAANAPDPPEGFDPMAAPMLRTQMDKRRKAIEKGYTYAVSARVLVQDIESRDLLTSLLYGVLYYGKLSAWQTWQVYQAIIPELGGTMADAQSCRAVWACPPAAATRRMGGEQYMMPPAFFVEAADNYCRTMAATQSDAAATSSVCADEDDAIPTEISDGMFGYFAAAPRSPHDALNAMFDGLDWDTDDGDEFAAVRELKETLIDLDNTKSDTDRSISKINVEMGVKDDGTKKYGPDGELYSLRNTCLEIPSGKYTYELCLFKSSKQREGKSGGTDLGKWTGASVNMAGQRLWSWEKGAKCWNGPHRSAWAYLTCGATTKIISADEPETCKYVFEVESHIACDEAYRAEHNLT